MTVHVPGPLRMYTASARVEVFGATLAQLLGVLEARFPGMRFRMIDEQDSIRPHIRFFVNGDLEWNLNRPLDPRDEIHIVCALSGGR
jgi:sulfur-carrier protein